MWSPASGQGRICFIINLKNTFTLLMLQILIWMEPAGQHSSIKDLVPQHKLFWGKMAQWVEVEHQAHKISRNWKAWRIWTQATSRASAQLVSTLHTSIVKENTTYIILIIRTTRWTSLLRITASSSTRIYQTLKCILKWLMTMKTKSWFQIVLVLGLSSVQERQEPQSRSNTIRTSTNSTLAKSTTLISCRINQYRTVLSSLLMNIRSILKAMKTNILEAGSSSLVDQSFILLYQRATRDEQLKLRQEVQELALLRIKRSLSRYPSLGARRRKDDSHPTSRWSWAVDRSCIRTISRVLKQPA